MPEYKKGPTLCALPSRIVEARLLKMFRRTLLDLVPGRILLMFWSLLLLFAMC
jgi:hypothetical protein